MFLSTYVFAVKGSQCFLRNVRQTDVAWHALLSGLLTGVSTYFERKSRVSELMLYCIPRGLSATFKYYNKRGYINPIPYGILFYFIIFYIFIKLIITN